MVYIIFFLALSFCDLSCAPITLIWQANKNKLWEQDWITELLQGIDYEVIQDGYYRRFIDNSIVIISTNNQFYKYENYFEKLSQLKYKFGVIHLSDESYAHSTKFYSSAQFVLRTSWHKKFKNYKNVITIPLGYKTGFWRNLSRELASKGKRDYSWSYAGQIQSQKTRKEMLAQMQKIPGYLFYETRLWADPRSLSVTEYQKRMLNSFFVPCPRGYWNLDSFRVYEALECGCIPLVEKRPIDYFKLCYGDHPFISVNSWSEAPGIISQLLGDPVALEQRRMRCYTWWCEYKWGLRKKIRDAIKKAFYAF